MVDVVINGPYDRLIHPAIIGGVRMSTEPEHIYVSHGPDNTYKLPAHQQITVSEAVLEILHDAHLDYTVVLPPEEEGGE
jgi:hypothetical protein